MKSSILQVFIYGLILFVEACSNDPNLKKSEPDKDSALKISEPDKADPSPLTQDPVTSETVSPQKIYEIYKFSNTKINLASSLQFSKTQLVSNFECSENILSQSNDESQALGHANNPINIAVSSIEFASHKFGGVGSIVNSSVSNLKIFLENENIKANIYVIGPYYEQGKYWKEATQKICTYEHVFNSQIVHSEILLSHYTVVNGKNAVKIPVLLVKAGSEIPDIFTTLSETDVYASRNGYNLFNRGLYFSSAVAAFIQGQSQSSQGFHILHGHSYVSSFPITLLSQIPITKRPLSVMHMHNLNGDQGLYTGYTCGNYDPCKAMPYIMQNSDAVMTVSKTMIVEGLRDEPYQSFGLNNVFQKLHSFDPTRTRIFGVANGISFDEWDPFKSENLTIQTPDGTRDFSFDPTSIFDSKKTIKEYLVQKGYIASADKPLFVFIGRYSGEKGIDMLAKAISTVKSNGGSFIVMGAKTLSVASGKIDVLRSLYDHDPDIHIMEGYPIKEQLGPEKTGMLVRAATDFVVVPSHEEAFGLVPIEFYAMGALAISSGISGMQDYLVQFDLRNLSGNSFTYKNYKEFPNGYKKRKLQEDVMEVEIQKAFRYFNTTTATDKSNVSLRLIEEAKSFDWLAKGGSMENYYSVYREILRRSNKRTIR